MIASSAATKTGENAEGQIMGKGQSHICEHDQHSFNYIRVLFADNFVQLAEPALAIPPLVLAA